MNVLPLHVLFYFKNYGLKLTNHHDEIEGHANENRFSHKTE